MTEQKHGGSAFPDGYENGMSLRDYFAGQALAGLIASNATQGLGDDYSARTAYAFADAMLEARAADKGDTS